MTDKFDPERFSVLAKQYYKIEDMYTFLNRRTERNPLPCNGCTACCYGMVVVIDPTTDPEPVRAYGADNLRLVDLKRTGRYQIALGQKKDGSCVFLTDKGCGVYEKRPSVCKAFDCRKIAWIFTKPEEREEAQKRAFRKEVFEAGDARMDTFELHPLEELISSVYDETSFYLGREKETPNPPRVGVVVDVLSEKKEGDDG